MKAKKFDFVWGNAPDVTKGKDGKKARPLFVLMVTRSVLRNESGKDELTEVYLCAYSTTQVDKVSAAHARKDGDWFYSSEQAAAMFAEAKDAGLHKPGVFRFSTGAVFAIPAWDVKKKLGSLGLLESGNGFSGELARSLKVKTTALLSQFSPR